MASSTPDKHSGLETAPATVSQPVKIESNLGGQLGSFLEDINRISESSGSGPGEQWSSSTDGTIQATGKQSAPVVSVRDQAIANIPTPSIMQKQLEKHIRDEVKKLRKQAQSVARMSQPGAAHTLNQLYTRIHHLNRLLSEIFEASVDVLKRLFVKVFIDRQPIL